MSEPDSKAIESGSGIGRIRRVRLRDVWRHEALDFTTWLEKNIDVIADATGLDLTGVEREQSAGAFSADLVAEDKEGRAVVIENQLEKSDHDHLGKLLTYLVGLEARRAVWIVADPRPEHVGVIAWLNESSAADFYLLKVEAVRIGDSEPAPVLTRIVGPSEDSRRKKEMAEPRRPGALRTMRHTFPRRKKKGIAEPERLRYRFFQGLLEYAKSKTLLHANISPSTESWVAAGAGIAGIVFHYWIRKHDARVELYIDTPDREENKRIFGTLRRHKDKIERKFGSPLEWNTKKGRRHCRILKEFDTGGWRDEDDWAAMYEELADAMAKLESAIKPHLKKP